LSAKLDTVKEIWSGGYYELAIELGPHSDENLDNALTALWSHNTLQGCWIERQKEYLDCEQEPPSLALLLSNSSLYGLATLPDGNRVVCGSLAVRESEEGDDGVERFGIDWLDFYVPVGALEKIYDVGNYPTDDSAVKLWLDPLNAWLVELGQHLYSQVRYKLALIGHEVCGLTYSDEVTSSAVPSKRNMGYLLPAAGQLNWYPPTLSSYW
jgi:hypothetical protein